MKTVGGGYKLSPNEEARLVKEETEKRRKIRLLQVREQSRAQASKIRNAVKNEKHRQLIKLSTELKEQLEKEKEEKIKKYEERYENTLKTIGQGHRGAKVEEIKESVREHKQKHKVYENDIKSQQRYNEALEQHQTEKAWEEYQENRIINARKEALEVEKARAAKIAALPAPEPDPLMNIDLDDIAKPIPLTDVEAFAFTRFHMAEDWGVVKAGPTEQDDARKAAEIEQERIDDLEDDRQRVVQERMEKARVRHKYALEKEILEHDYDHILHDLSDLQREDRERRQKVVATIPKQVFLPPYKRIEEKDEKQKEMEEAFEDMYLKTTDYTGDISLAVDAHPPPDTPNVSENHDTCSEMDGEDLPEHSVDITLSKSVLKDVTNTMKSADASNASVVKPGTMLRKLFDRIKVQRKECESKVPDDTPVKELQSDSPSVAGKVSPSKDETLSEYSLNDSDGKKQKTPEKGENKIPNFAHSMSPPTRDVTGPVIERQEELKTNELKSKYEIPVTTPITSEVNNLVKSRNTTGISDKDINVSNSSQSTNSFMEQLQNRESKQLLEEVMEQMKTIDLQRKELEEKLVQIDAQHQKISNLPHNKLRGMACYKLVPTEDSSGMKHVPKPSSGKHTTTDQLVSKQQLMAGNVASVPQLCNFEKPLPLYGQTTNTGQLQKSLDGSNVLPLQKVRDYQKMLVERHQQSKKILEDTKQEILDRRKNLSERFPFIDSQRLSTENNQNDLTVISGNDLLVPPVDKSLNRISKYNKDIVGLLGKTTAERNVSGQSSDFAVVSESNKLDSVRKSLPFDEDSPVKPPVVAEYHLSRDGNREYDFETAATKSNGSSPNLSRMKSVVQDSTDLSTTGPEAPYLQGLAEEQHKSLEKFKKQLVDLQNRKDDIMKQSEQIKNRDLASQMIALGISDESLQSVSPDKNNKPTASNNQLYPIHSHVPHDLSTILEMDTPVTVLSSGRPSLVNKSSSQLHSKRSLDFSEISPQKDLAPDMSLLSSDKNVPQTSDDLDGVLQRAKEYNTSLLDKIRRQTNDVFSVLNEGEVMVDSKSGQPPSFHSSYSLSQHTISDIGSNSTLGTSAATKTSLFDSYKSDWKPIMEDKSCSLDISTSSQSSRHTWAEELAAYRRNHRASPVFKDFSLLSQNSASFKNLTPVRHENSKSNLIEQLVFDSVDGKDNSGQSAQQPYLLAQNSCVAANIGPNINLTPKKSQELIRIRDNELSQYSLTSENSSMSTDRSKNLSPLQHVPTDLADRSSSIGPIKDMSNFSVSSYGELSDMMHRFIQPVQRESLYNNKTPEFHPLRPDSSESTRLESTGEHPSNYKHRLGISGLSQISDTSKSDYGLGKLESTGSEGHPSQAFIISGLSQISNISKPDSILTSSDEGIIDDKFVAKTLTDSEVATPEKDSGVHKASSITEPLSQHPPSTNYKHSPSLFTVSSLKDLTNQNSLSQFTVSEISDIGKLHGLPQHSISGDNLMELQQASSLFSVSSLSQHTPSSASDINQIPSATTTGYLPSFSSSTSDHQTAPCLKADKVNAFSVDEDNYPLVAFSISSYRDLPDKSKLGEENILASSLYVPLEKDTEASLEQWSLSGLENHKQMLKEGDLTSRNSPPDLSQYSIKTDDSSLDQENMLRENASQCDSHQLLEKQESKMSSDIVEITQASVLSSDFNSNANELWSENQLGISDEPNLTLMTLGSDVSFGVLSEISVSQKKERTDGSSLLIEQLDEENRSIENGCEEGVVIYTPADQRAQNNIPTLKDVFLQKKKDFVVSSENRKAAVKEKVRLGEATGGTALSKTLFSWKKNRTMKTGPPRPVVSVKKLPSPRAVKTSEDRKKAQKEMIEINRRLYNQLDEVKQKNVERERVKKYAENREKAKEYQKKLREKIKKKQEKKS